MAVSFGLSEEQLHKSICFHQCLLALEGFETSFEVVNGFVFYVAVGRLQVTQQL